MIECLKGQGCRHALSPPQELQDEFPDEVPLVERLTKTSREFKQLAARYDEIGRHIYRIESEEEPTTDGVLERLKKQRLKLKNGIATMFMKSERRM